MVWFRMQRAAKPILHIFAWLSARKIGAELAEYGEK